MLRLLDKSTKNLLLCKFNSVISKEAFLQSTIGDLASSRFHISLHFSSIIKAKIDVRRALQRSNYSILDSNPLVFVPFHRAAQI